MNNWPFYWNKGASYLAVRQAISLWAPSNAPHLLIFESIKDISALSFSESNWIKWIDPNWIHCVASIRTKFFSNSFFRLFIASRISPSEEINSEYIKSAPWSLHNLRKGGSLTSSIGAKSKGKSGNSMLPILTIFIIFCKITTFSSICTKLRFKGSEQQRFKGTKVQRSKDTKVFFKGLKGSGSERLRHLWD